MITPVFAYEPIPDGPCVFIAGPTPRASQVASWRPHTLPLIDDAWAGTDPLNVLIPEPRDGRWTTHYDEQVEWEEAGLTAAIDRGSILFWIPRDVTTLPGFTTNTEAGWYFRDDVYRREQGLPGRVVVGLPPDCPDSRRNWHLGWLARRHGIPICETLADTVKAAVAMV